MKDASTTGWFKSVITIVFVFSAVTLALDTDRNARQRSSQKFSRKSQLEIGNAYLNRNNHNRVLDGKKGKNGKKTAAEAQQIRCEVQKGKKGKKCSMPPSSAPSPVPPDNSIPDPFAPSQAPTITARPSKSVFPSLQPSMSSKPSTSLEPSNAPSTNNPTHSPTKSPTKQPSASPTKEPTTSPTITLQNRTRSPSLGPTESPTVTVSSTDQLLPPSMPTSDVPSPPAPTLPSPSPPPPSNPVPSPPAPSPPSSPAPTPPSPSPPPPSNPAPSPPAPSPPSSSPIPPPTPPSNQPPTISSTMPDTTSGPVVPPSLSLAPNPMPTSTTATPTKQPIQNPPGMPSFVPTNHPSFTPSESIAPSRTPQPSISAKPSNAPSVSVLPSSLPSTSSFPTVTPLFDTEVVRGENGAVGQLSTCRDVPAESLVEDSSNSTSTAGSSGEVMFRYIIFVKKFADDMDGVIVSLEDTIHSTFTNTFLDCEFSKIGLRRWLTTDLDLKSVSSLPRAKLSVPETCPQEMLRQGTDCYIIDDAITIDSTMMLTDKTVVNTFDEFFSEEMGSDGPLVTAHPDILDLGFYLDMTSANITTTTNRANTDGTDENRDESDNFEPPNSITTDPDSVTGSGDARVLGPTLIAGATTGVVLVGLLAYRKKDSSSQTSYMEYDEDEVEFSDEYPESPPVENNDVSCESESSIWQFSETSGGVEVSRGLLQREALGALDMDAPDDEHHCMSDSCKFCAGNGCVPSLESQSAALEVVRNMSYRTSLPRSPRSYDYTDTVDL